MSYTALVPFKDGVPAGQYEFRNAWGGCARIWQSLADYYLSLGKYEHYLQEPHIKKLWGLVDNDVVKDYEKVCLAFTFDLALVKRENFDRIARDLRDFATARPVAPARIDHLVSWARCIEGLDAEAVGLWGNSVSDNLWCGWDEGLDEAVPYDLRDRTDHFYVYDHYGRQTDKETP